MQTQPHDAILDQDAAGPGRLDRPSRLGPRDAVSVATAARAVHVLIIGPTLGARPGAEVPGRRRRARVVRAPLHDPEGGPMRR